MLDIEDFSCKRFLNDKKLCVRFSEKWTYLEVLNVCRNKLKALPPQLCKLEHVRRLYLNENELDFDGIPSGIGKLGALEVFSAAYNKLEMIPEGLCRQVFFSKCFYFL